MDFAPIATVLTNGVLSSGSFVLFGGILTNRGAGTLVVNVVDAIGTMVLPASIRIFANSSISLNVAVIADNGVQANVISGSAANLSFTIFRSNTGS